MKVKGYVLACLSAMFYGTIPLFGIPLKQSGISFDTVLLYRFIFAVGMLGLYLVVRKTDLHLRRKDILPLAFLGVMYAASADFLFWAYDYMAAGVASTLLFVYPVFVALLMGILFRERISPVMWMAIFLALGGICILNGGGGQTDVKGVGIVLVLLSALAYALYIVGVNKSCVRDMSGLSLTFYTMLFCTAYFLVKDAIVGRLQFLPSVRVNADVMLFSLVTTVLSCLTLTYAIHLIGSTPTSILGSLEPTTGVCISVVLFGEPFTPHLLTGIVLILSAVSLIILSDHVTKDIRKLAHAALLIRHKR